MNASQARLIPITELLQTAGLTPQRTNGREAWYVSPFRAEAEGSFVVHVVKNAYYDHGEGKGGNALDLAVRLFNTDVKGALRRLSALQLTAASNTISFRQQGRVSSGERAIGSLMGTALATAASRIENLKVVTLQNRALFGYLGGERKIDLKTAQSYLREAHFTNNGKQYFALAFPNDRGGFELRNKYFQGSTTPKHWTTFQNFEDRSDTLNVFEGFMDYLSALTHYKTQRFKGDVVVLNSLSFAAQVAKEVALQYRNVNLFLDNDGAGIGAVKLFHAKAVNRAIEIYPASKDFNDFLVSR